MEQWIEHAVNISWVVDNGDVISPGEVNPVPVTESMETLAAAVGRRDCFAVERLMPSC